MPVMFCHRRPSGGGAGDQTGASQLKRRGGSSRWKRSVSLTCIMYDDRTSKHMCVYFSWEIFFVSTHINVTNVGSDGHMTTWWGVFFFWQWGKDTGSTCISCHCLHLGASFPLLLVVD